MQAAQVICGPVVWLPAAMSPVTTPPNIFHVPILIWERNKKMSAGVNVLVLSGHFVMRQTALSQTIPAVILLDIKNKNWNFHLKKNDSLSELSFINVRSAAVIDTTIIVTTTNYSR